ncbi:MAG: ATP-binding cassette domain-containing protein [Rhizobiaceae bacterium]|nr:ATP-binding cassette domain-containing protein [Rhizobiaceae bacterium]
MTDVLVGIENLSRDFDVSKPWLNRVLENEEKKFVTAVNDVSFEIRRGETFALVGESGSGKSTIAKLIVGLIRPTGGQILFDGTNVATRGSASMRQLRSRFQMIFQDPFASLNPRWRVKDIIAEPLRTFGVVEGRAAWEKRVDELLETVGLSAKDGAKYPHEFSGGQRQRVAIARALSAQPEFIVCDEPTSALDVSVQAQILNLMRDLQDEFGLTYLFISHDLSVVRHMASRIGVLYLGRLVEVAEGKTLFREPKHPYTKMLLDAVPDLEMTGRSRQPVEGEIPNPIDPPSGCTYHPRCPLANDRCKREVPVLKLHENTKAACFALEEGRG